MRSRKRVSTAVEVAGLRPSDLIPRYCPLPRRAPAPAADGGSGHHTGLDEGAPLIRFVLQFVAQSTEHLLSILAVPLFRTTILYRHI